MGTLFDIGRDGILLPPSGLSVLKLLSMLPKEEQKAFLIQFGALELEALKDDWQLNARREQLPPAGDWRIWLILAGRGFGKTRTGAERIYFKHKNGLSSASALLGPTIGDIRDYMVEGDSGILSVAKDDFLPDYLPSKRQIEWPNGSRTYIYTAEEPERIRGPNLDFVWADELCAWAEHSDEQLEYIWKMIRLCLRLGNPETIITTTPKPRSLLRKLLKRDDVIVTTGSTYANRDNLAPAFFDELERDFEGTRLGRQELHAEVLSLLDGGLWTEQMIKDAQCKETYATLKDKLVRIVVAVDPATSAHEGSDMTAIVVGGMDAQDPPNAYVLGDFSMRGSPQSWGSKVCSVFNDFDASLVVVEVNQGGDMVKHTLHSVDDQLPIKMIKATKGKVTRAEPIVTKYEQGRVKHVSGLLDLEEQLCMMKPGRMKKSPDRGDATVYLIEELLGGFKSRAGVWGGARHAIRSQ